MTVKVKDEKNEWRNGGTMCPELFVFNKRIGDPDVSKEVIIKSHL